MSLSRRWLALGFLTGSLAMAPVALAVGWTDVGGAGIRLNERVGLEVHTANPVYSSQMRLYVTVHSPCGGDNFQFGYIYPDGGSYYALSGTYEICTAQETPAYWNVNGGNKFAQCKEIFEEPSNPTSTCQRYSTT